MIPDVPSRPCIDDHLLKLGPITGIPAWKKNDGLQRFSYLSRYMEGLKQLGSFNTVEASINGELDNPKLSRCRWSGGVSSKWCDANRPLFCWWFGTWILRLSIQLGMSSSQLTKSIIFQRGRLNHQLVLVFYKFTEENETYPVIITVFTRFNPPKKGGTWCSDCQTRPCIIQIWVISAYLCLNCWSPTFHKCFFS